MNASGKNIAVHIIVKRLPRSDIDKTEMENKIKALDMNMI
jgi:hypothetical protein